MCYIICKLMWSCLEEILFYCFHEMLSQPYKNKFKFHFFYIYIFSTLFLFVTFLLMFENLWGRTEEYLSFGVHNIKYL